MEALDQSKIATAADIGTMQLWPSAATWSPRSGCLGLTDPEGVLLRAQRHLWILEASWVLQQPLCPLNFETVPSSTTKRSSEALRDMAASSLVALAG